ncbi:helix-turn-helix transcriptional regulator [Microbacterium sp. GXF7504]
MTRPAYSAISSYSRVRVLHLLQERPRRTVAELCERTGLHANTVREHLQRLIDGGYVVAEPEKRTTRGRPRVLYSAAAADENVSPIALRKAREAAARGDLMRKVMPWTAGAAGDLPTEAVHQLDALVDDLGAAGFDPVVDEASLTVDLSPCPHAASDDGARSTLCAVHLGLMDGVLAQAGGPLRIAGMAPSCNPADCVVHLGR